MISFTNVSKLYQHEKKAALRDVSFSIKKGEFVSIVGPSGEGKSTLLKIIAGIEKPTSGEVTIPERVSMAFQSGALFPWLSVFDNVAFGLRAQGMSDRDIESITIKYIRMMGLTGCITKYPADLSGGQRQRVGIARALAVDPDVLLLDEPFSALDPKTTAELHDDIIRIWRETGKTIVMVSHIIEEAVSLSQRVLLLKKGELYATFKIDLLYPRRDQGHHFMYEVERIRKDFFR